MTTVLYFQSPLKTSAQKKLDGIRDIAGRLGWHVQVVESKPTRSAVRQLAAFWHPVGAIVECGGWDRAVTDTKAFGSLPLVHLDAPAGTLGAGAFGVAHDSFQTGEAAARALLESGRTAFAYVAYPSPRTWSDERRDGFRRALALNGRDVRVLESAPGASSPLAFQRRLARFLASLPRPSAILVANDSTAETVIGEIWRQGARVPEDFAVLGVDNYATICERIGLSSVEPDFRRGGNLAMLMLAAVVRDGKSFRGRRLRLYRPLRTVTRASTRASVRPADAEVAAALDLIHREACGGLTAESVLGTFSCSRALAAARFRRTTGRTILGEIHLVRLERAKDMLRDPHLQIKAISDFCGFGNPNSLKKFFKRETGLTMREWRARAERLSAGHRS